MGDIIGGVEADTLAGSPGKWRNIMGVIDLMTS